MLCLSGFELYSRWVPLYSLCFISSQRVLHAHRRESQAANQDGETVPIPIPGTFSGRVPQIIELVTVSCIGVVFM